MRLILRFLAYSLLFVILAIAGLLGWNNRPVQAPSRESLSHAYDRAVQWVVENQAPLIAASNTPILWWMLEQSARLQGDARLQAAVEKYKDSHIRNDRRNKWQHLFNPASNAPARIRDVENEPDYYQYMFYALTCNTGLLEAPLIASQQDADFCRKYRPISPACPTHHLMGVRFLQRRHCGDQDEAAALARKLQDKIVNLLTFDPRLVDVYIQRVVMLVDSGARDRVKPVWLSRILKAQLPDGGWDEDQKLVPGVKGEWLKLTHRSIGIGKSRSELHATAQAIWLLALLLAET